ncbi:hypothetical protein LIER_40131 [Lithospermum erythrorhizon]|uniref:Reverse transcriptase n=1 Tax=Lithospermum erythrorhizon TaxID=34254 RepID=A0AAV3QTH4_LITER
MEVAFTEEDVKRNVFSMHGTKYLGPDRMSTVFFQHNWEAVGPDICSMVLRCDNNGIFFDKFNFTLISLVPKVVVPINTGQFRPITLCNVAAKVIAKVIVTRLKGILASVISQSQSAFVPQTLITDNVLIAFEAHHFIKNQRSGRKGFMSIKLDMLKACDRI